jgi:plasmid stabilization system protein ParE
MGKVVIWSEPSLQHLSLIHGYILKESGSLTTADNVIDKIIKSTQILSNQPKINPPDKFKLNNNGDYRAYEIYSYRIAYRILLNKVRILRIRHTSQEPLKY